HAPAEGISELLPMKLELGPEGRVRRIGVAVSLAPDAVVPEESQECRLVHVAPAPFRLEGRDRLRRARQEPGGILSGCFGRSEPVPGDDAEVATAPAGMGPPEVTMRVGRLPGRHHGARPSALVHRDHLDRIQIIRCEAELAAEEAKGATGHMPAHADLRILTERYHDSPRLEQRPERLAHRGAGLD